MAENQNAGSDEGQTAAPDKASVKLQKQVDSLTSENAQLKAQVLSISGDRDTLADANQKLQAELEEKTTELEQAEALIEEQNGKLAAAEVTQAEGPVVVSHEKAQYRVLAPKFSHKGLEVDAHTLRQNPELVRELVEAGSGLLQKVEPAK
jgi:chromosome segregation ATPase